MASYACPVEGCSESWNSDATGFDPVAAFEHVRAHSALHREHRVEEAA